MIATNFEFHPSLQASTRPFRLPFWLLLTLLHALLATGSYAQTFYNSDTTITTNTPVDSFYVNANVTVTGAGAWLNSSEQGYVDTGSLTVSNGGKVSTTGFFDSIYLAATLNIGAAAGDSAAAAGIMDTERVWDNSGTPILQFNTTGTNYFTRDGTATGVGVNTLQGVQLIHTAGTNVFTGTLQHTGGTTINGGTMRIGNGGTAGSITNNITNNSALVFNRSDSYAYGSAVSGTGTLTQAGPGTLTLTGSHSFTGATTVEAGTLLFNTTFSTSAVTVNSGADLGGSGTLGQLATVSTGGTLLGGSSSLTFGNGLTLSNGSILDLALGSSFGTLAVTGGNLTFGSGLIINLTDAGDFDAGTYNLINASGSTISSTNVGLFTFGTTIAGYSYALAWTGNILQLTANVSAVPEPSTYALFAGLGMLGFVAWRRRSARS